MRWLLQHVTARSYADLRTVDGVLHKTFQSAAAARGLRGSQEEVLEAMRELANGPDGRVGSDLRAALATLLISAEFNVPSLVDAFYQQLTVDLRGTPEAIWNSFLADMKDRVERMGATLASIGLPEPQSCRTEREKERFRWDPNAAASEEQKLAAEMAATPAAREQSALYDEVIDKLEKWKNAGRTVTASSPAPQFFIDAGQGRGKTTLARRVIARLRSDTNNVVLVVASTGLAALNYQGGSTAHAMFRIPVPESGDEDEELRCNVGKSTQRAELLRSATVIIWDELPMANAAWVDAVDKLLSDLTGDPRAYASGSLPAAQPHRGASSYLQNL